MVKDKFEELRDKAHADLKKHDEMIDALFNVVYFAESCEKLKQEEKQLKKTYPAGSCNAEDAWRDFGRSQDEAEKGLKKALDYLRKM